MSYFFSMRGPTNLTNKNHAKNVFLHTQHTLLATFSTYILIYQYIVSVYVFRKTYTLNIHYMHNIHYIHALHPIMHKTQHAIYQTLYLQKHPLVYVVYVKTRFSHKKNLMRQKNSPFSMPSAPPPFLFVFTSGRESFRVGS